MNCENILIEKLEYQDSMLYVYYYFCSNDRRIKKILKFKNVKKFSHHFSHDYLNLMDEFSELREETGNEFFFKIFYRNKKRKKIYIFDQIDAFVIIEFNKEKKWNYREQKK
ncbi:hypothetical protein IX329_002608 [Fusobacterium necrophorum]|uniref:Uncharacterized protein n=1 Tax=Fusobacterium equinum TaxID=134605 RepID=A0A133NJ88_9FUSO|nr:MULTISPECIES: hypothetical protein [Fusobacterium]EYD69447.1 hypothetical protein FNF_04161 [Fusobacterium necrophorum subsp. funduliforme B35]KXA16349.1 hypothetical protein HMPREF3206_00420 [Fusobacterium equinum]MBR8734991.1 hypothetical protein [Fusobacterium necrophorum]MBR8791164.1 hypothetical protein [Fusobacterium necrophorum]